MTIQGMNGSYTPLFTSHTTHIQVYAHPQHCIVYCCLRDHLTFSHTIKSMLSSSFHPPSNTNFYLNTTSYSKSVQNYQDIITTMQANEIAELDYLVPPNLAPYPGNFSLTQNNIPTFEFSRVSNPLLYNLQITPQIQEFTQATCFSSNSTSDEGDEQQLSIINERKQRRMISNRESARRSRMRKQKHLDELRSRVLWLRNENHQLVEKLNNFSETHDKVLQENARLKEEASELHQKITHTQINSPYPTLSDLADIQCSPTYLGTDSSNQSITSSSDLLP